MSVNYNIIGKRIQDRRKGKGLRQSDLATLLGCSTGYVSQVESGRVKINLDLMGKLSELLDCEITDFLEKSNDPAFEQDRNDILSVYRRLDEQDKKLAYEMLLRFCCYRQEDCKKSEQKREKKRQKKTPG